MAKDAGDLYLAEYNSLRTEQMSRMQTQGQAFNFLLVIVGAAITAIISAANATNRDHLPWVVTLVTLLLPLAACPLGYMFFDNEIMIHSIGSYLYHNRRHQMIAYFSNPDILGNTLAFKGLPDFTDQVFPWVSRGRWILFCIPTFLPVVFFPFISAAVWPVIEHSLLLTDYSTFLVSALILLFYALDIIACLLLGKAIYWTFVNDRYQRSHP
jgi:hypothetical protein